MDKTMFGLPQPDSMEEMQEWGEDMAKWITEMGPTAIYTNFPSLFPYYYWSRIMMEGNSNDTPITLPEDLVPEANKIIEAGIPKDLPRGACVGLYTLFVKGLSEIKLRIVDGQKVDLLQQGFMAWLQGSGGYGAVASHHSPLIARWWMDVISNTKDLRQLILAVCDIDPWNVDLWILAGSLRTYPKLPASLPSQDVRNLFQLALWPNYRLEGSQRLMEAQSTG